MLAKWGNDIMGQLTIIGDLSMISWILWDKHDFMGIRTDNNGYICLLNQILLFRTKNKKHCFSMFSNKYLVILK